MTFVWGVIGAPIPTADLTVADRDALRTVVDLAIAVGGVGDGTAVFELSGAPATATRRDAG